MAPGIGDLRFRKSRVLMLHMLRSCWQAAGKFVLPVAFLNIGLS